MPLLRVTRASDPRVRVAQYLRMSTEHQRYSIENQRAAIAQYADARSYEIVATYEDPGRSGLRLARRPGLQRLLADVEQGASYCKVLVLDVSRWGRFQDNDESAFHEFRCRQAGVDVEYCAETFQRDGSVMSDVIKAIKRAMAGEFSRELGVKVVRAQRRLAAMGFKQGGEIPYGVRRVLKSDSGRPDQLLRRGQNKHLSSDRVVLAAGPPEERQLVRNIFQLFCRYRLAPSLIAKLLNMESGVERRPNGWNAERVTRLLLNDIYTGDYVYHKTSCRLGRALVNNPRASWVVKKRVFAPIISAELFACAAALFAEFEELSRSEKLRFFRHRLLDAPAPLKRRLGRFLALPGPALSAALTTLDQQSPAGQNTYRVYRSEGKSLGWTCAAKFQELRRTMFFADSEYGSKEASRAAAVAWDLKNEGLVAEHIRLRRRLVMNKNNRSGITGVCRIDNRSPRHPFWMATWIDDDGRYKARRFSVGKYGEEISFEHAVEARRKAVQHDVCRFAILTAQIRTQMEGNRQRFAGTSTQMP